MLYRGRGLGRVIQKSKIKMAKAKNEEASVFVPDSLFSLQALLEDHGSFYVADNFKCKIEC